jgi:hypothetical protein
MNNAEKDSKEDEKPEIQKEKTETASVFLPEELLGSWKLEMPGMEEGVPDQLFRRIFHRGETGSGLYEMYWIASLPDIGPTVMACEKGDLLINADTIFMTSTAFGSEQKGPQSDEFYDTIRWYYPGDSMFNMFRNDPYGLFAIEGDTLFWKLDMNNDGKFIDQNEITRFLREKK